MQGNSREEKPRRETAPFSRTVCHLKAQPGARLTPAEAHGRARAQSRASRALGGAEPRASVNSANHVSLPPPRPRLAPPRPATKRGSGPRARSRDTPEREAKPNCARRLAWPIARLFGLPRGPASETLWPGLRPRPLGSQRGDGGGR